MLILRLEMSWKTTRSLLLHHVHEVIHGHWRGLRRWLSRWLRRRLRLMSVVLLVALVGEKIASVRKLHGETLTYHSIQ